jgi:hypothetical protein
VPGPGRELTLPIARELNIPPENVFANRINWQVDDATGLVTKMVGYDERELTSKQGGKPAAIALLRGVLMRRMVSCWSLWLLCTGVRKMIMVSHAPEEVAAVSSCREVPV